MFSCVSTHVLASLLPTNIHKKLREGEINNTYIQKDMKEFFRCETIELMKLLLERCCEVIPSFYQKFGIKEINHQRKKSKFYICNCT